jgi:hypothetical protein
MMLFGLILKAVNYRVWVELCCRENKEVEGEYDRIESPMFESFERMNSDEPRTRQLWEKGTPIKGKRASFVRLWATEDALEG